MNTDPGMNSNKDYLSTGRFAQVVGLSRKALRLYNKLGILVPEYVDPQSGYRYYNPSQIEQARTIRLLRVMDMSLADIRRVLAAATKEEAIQLVVDCQQAFEDHSNQVRLAYQKVLAALRKEEEPMSVEVTVQSFPFKNAVTIKKQIAVEPFQDFIPEALQRLKAYLEENQAQISGDPFCFYYGPVNENDDGPVEIGFPFMGEVNPKKEIQVLEIPAHQAAVGRAAPIKSRFPEIIEVWDDVISWVNRNKFRISEDVLSCYEIWHEDDSISIVQPIVEVKPGE
jgi:DNA-binding transcriptional MerR regulator